MPRLSKAVLVPMLAALIAACVSPDDPGVAIENIEADLVFGIEEAPEPVVPANTNPGAVPQTPIEIDLGEFRNPVADRLPPLNAVAPESECPAALPTAAAEKPTDVTITGPVQEGVYLWKRDGSQLMPNPTGGEPVSTRIEGFERRIIRNVKPYDDPFDPNAYTFEMVQPLLDRPVVQVRTFLVKPQTSAQVAPGGLVVIDEPRANEPEGGISLLQVEEFTEDDESLGTFQPTNGLLLAGLPIDASETFQSTAVDPKSGQTIVQDGAMRGRARVDACGELVDGWRVETTQVRSDIGGQTTYNYVLAPQYGGMLILEEVSIVSEEGIETNVTFSLGQLVPDPLDGGGA